MTIQNLKESGVLLQSLNSLIDDSADQLLLIRLIRDQITKFWEPIWFAIKEAMPPSAGEVNLERENNVHQMIVQGDLEVYLFIRSGQILALTSLMVQYEPVTKTRNLLIYSLYGFENLPLKDWMEGLTRVRNIALAKKCEYIIAETNNERVKQIVRSFGGDTSWSLVKLGVFG